MLTIGITGGIGSGKSTVAKFLAEQGAPIIDADKVGHAIYAPDGPAYSDVVAAFGSQTPCYRLDRLHNFGAVLDPMRARAGGFSHSNAPGRSSASSGCRETQVTRRPRFPALQTG